MSLPPAILLQDSSTFTSKELFFKSLPKVQLEKEEDWDSPGGSPLLPKTIHSLCIVNSVGCALILDQNINGQVLLLPVEPLIDGQHVTIKEEKEFCDQIKNKIIKIKNKWLCNTLIPPGQILISPDELYFAVEVFRGGEATQDILHFLLIYQTIDFIKNKDESVPLIEVRLSTSSSNNIESSILAWNPVCVSEEKKHERIISIYCPDGNLILIQVKGQNAIEIVNSRAFINPRIMSMCWSPKGKQLAVGLSDGSLRQLKMNLSDAKMIPTPPRENNNDIYHPKSLLWVSTLQFFILYEINSSDLDFMILELPKGSPPTYNSYGDIFTSDFVQGNSYCKFIQQSAWDTVICICNTGSDIILLKKLIENNLEKWNIVDIFEDSRRPTLPIDNYLIGAGVFKGYYEQGILFSESEMYENMPVLIIMSQTGLLVSHFFVNNEPNMSKICLTSPSPFQSIISQLNQQKQHHQQQQAFNEEEIVPRDPRIKPPQYQQPQQQQQQQQQQSSPFMFQQPQAASQSVHQHQQQGPSLFQQQQQIPQGQGQSFTGFKMPELPPGSKDVNKSNPMFPTLMKQLEKPAAQYQDPNQQQQLAGITKQQQQQSFQQQPSLTIQQKSQIQPQASTADLLNAQQQQQQQQRKRKSIEKADIETEIETVNMKLVLLKIKSFNERLDKFKETREMQFKKINERISILLNKYDQELMPSISEVTTFVEELVEVTNSQTDDVALLKKNHLMQYKYLEEQRTLLEQQNDPNYIRLKKAQPIPPDLLQKLTKIQEQFRVIKKQVNESCQSLYYDKLNKESPLNDEQTLEMILKTVLNHSKIIQHLNEELSRVQAAYQNKFGYIPIKDSLPAVPALDEETAADGDTDEKDLLLFETLCSTDENDEISFDELISGVTSIKLNRPSIYPHKQPVIMTGDQVDEIRSLGKNKKVLLINPQPAVLNLSPKPKSENSSSIEKKIEEGGESEFENFLTKERDIIRKSLTSTLTTQKPVRTIIHHKSPIIGEKSHVQQQQQHQSAFKTLEKDKVTFGQQQGQQQVVPCDQSILKSHLLSTKQPQTEGLQQQQQQTPPKQKTVGFGTPLSSSTPSSSFPTVSSSIFENISPPLLGTPISSSTNSAFGSFGGITTGIQPKNIFGDQNTTDTISSNLFTFTPTTSTTSFSNEKPQDISFNLNLGLGSSIFGNDNDTIIDNSTTIPTSDEDKSRTCTKTTLTSIVSPFATSTFESPSIFGATTDPTTTSSSSLIFSPNQNQLETLKQQQQQQGSTTTTTAGKQEISQKSSSNIFGLDDSPFTSSKTTTSSSSGSGSLSGTTFAAAVVSPFSSTTTTGSSIFGNSSIFGSSPFTSPAAASAANQKQLENTGNTGKETESAGGSLSIFGGGSSGDSLFSTLPVTSTTSTSSPFTFTPTITTGGSAASSAGTGTTESPSIFGALKINSTPAFGTSPSVFGGGQQQQQSPIGGSVFGGSPSSTAPQTTNLFGAPVPVIGQSGFGQPSAFGSPIGGGNAFGSSSIFGASQQQQSPQQTSNLFGSGGSSFASTTATSAASPFSFTPTASATNSSGFGSSSIFGTSPTKIASPLAAIPTQAFGAPPVFGQPAFGQAPAFGNTQSNPLGGGNVFGGGSIFGGSDAGSSNIGQTTFGQTASQNIFGGGPASFGSFGALAQPQQQQQQQQQAPVPSFGGSPSFSSWR